MEQAKLTLRDEVVFEEMASGCRKRRAEERREVPARGSAARLIWVGKVLSWANDREGRVSVREGEHLKSLPSRFEGRTVFENRTY